MLLLRELVCPESPETYRLPPLSTTAMDETFVAMQAVSTLPSVHAGIPPSTAIRGPSGLSGRR